MSELSTTIQGVRFSCSSGKAKRVVLIAQFKEEFSEFVGESVLISGGVTGYESFVVESADFGHMIAYGWWACAGTPGSWDALYIHGLQVKRMLEDLELI